MESLKFEKNLQKFLREESSLFLFLISMSDFVIQEELSRILDYFEKVSPSRFSNKSFQIAEHIRKGPGPP